MVYAGISNSLAILILNFLTNYFFFLGPIFLLIINMIILESTLVYSVKRQTKFILLYGIVLLAGMIILVLMGVVFDKSLKPLLGIQIINGGPKWGLIFFFYVITVVSCFTIIPVIYTNFKIYYQFESNELKRKWRYYLIGFLGLAYIFYSLCVYNILDPVKDSDFRILISLLSVSVILWGYLMYNGIGAKLKL
ncbi:MAG: hypothetical protein ACFFDH_14495 [Promethearchaeota archaeon]